MPRASTSYHLSGPTRTANPHSNPTKSMSPSRESLLLSFITTTTTFLAILSPFPLLASSSPTPDSFLHAFLTSLPPPSQHLLSWNQSLTACLWPGVTCSSPSSPLANAIILSLNLSGIGLSASLAASVPHLCSIPTLLSLDLSDNRFSGPIPPSLFRSCHLLYLDLGRNHLTGMIPLEVTSSPGLQYLGLYENYLTGEIPHDLLHILPNLTYLYLNTNNLTGLLPDFPVGCSIVQLYVHENMLSGPLPDSLINCSNLTQFIASDNELDSKLSDIFSGLPRLEMLYLNSNSFVGELPTSLESLEILSELRLSENQFNGSIPDGIGRCRSLTVLSLWGNCLTGGVPRSIGDLDGLQSLMLGQNQLTDPLPPELGNCSSLVEVELQDNFITGHIPPDIGRLNRLETLYLFNNSIEGVIPTEIGMMERLVSLQLYNNGLNGEIPVEITHLRNLRHLSLANNNLTGELPSALRDLIILDLTGNNLQGSIPAGLCSGNNLTVLVLGRNQFNGSFPVEVARCTSLRRVILSNNQLGGTIQEALPPNPGISYLDLSNNNFEGQVPASFGSWHNLSMLDISNNWLSGKLPPELGNLNNLAVLQLSSNRLTGSIPSQLGQCTKLLRLDLSGNLLSGIIPEEIILLDKLQSLWLAGNKLTGAIPDLFTPFQSLLELQLGDNMFVGSIPRSLGKLNYISLALNLSKNRLVGEIPASLGSLDKLQRLDLSNNSLSGEIPLGLNSMISLLFMDVSFNQLSGKLQSNWCRFITTSLNPFMGNPDLSVQDCLAAQEQHGLRKDRWVLLVTALFFIVAGLCGAICIAVRGYYLLPSPQVSICRTSATESMPDDLTYDDILRATEDLSEKYVIGRGMHGTVYRTEFGIGKCWAVKKLELSESSFIQEMKILSMVKHRNVVRMAGYCIRDGFGMIIYEYLTGGTLFEVLHWKKPQIPLDWKVRHRMALGIAQGLSYLHHDFVPQIIHRDVKTNNILMDSELEPKLGDFGMAKLVNGDDAESTISAIIGTLGYIAPENGYSTRLNEKCDVYSYGVVLLELICRKMALDPSFEDGVDIVSWIKSNMSKADQCGSFCSLDEEISFWTEDEKEKALKLLTLAISCTQVAREARPTMREIVGLLLKLSG